MLSFLLRYVVNQMIKKRGRAVECGITERSWFVNTSHIFTRCNPEYTVCKNAFKYDVEVSD